MKTKAAVLYELNSPLVIEEIEIPKLKEGQVLVKVLYSGVCRSQLNEIKGFKGPDKFLPHLLGHEGSGIVQEVGEKVRKVKKGDYAVLSWIKGKGIEALSAQYKKGNTVINSGAIATFSQYAVISENRLVKIPEEIPADTAALLGCAIPTGAGVITNTLKVNQKSSLAVFGIGGIGASAILAAKMKKCKTIIAVDVAKQKLEYAKKLGATHVLEFDENNCLASLKRICPQGIDFALEASGAKRAMELAFEIIHKQGTAVIAGNLRSDEKIMLNPFDFIKGKRIIGTWGGETDPDKDIPQYAAAYRKGTLPLDSLITHRFQLEDINKAVSALEQGRAGRILIELNGK